MRYNGDLYDSIGLITSWAPHTASHYRTARDRCTGEMGYVHTIHPLLQTIYLNCLYGQPCGVHPGLDNHGDVGDWKIPDGTHPCAKFQVHWIVPRLMILEGFFFFFNPIVSKKSTKPGACDIQETGFECGIPSAGGIWTMPTCFISRSLKLKATWINHSGKGIHDFRKVSWEP